MKEKRNSLSVQPVIQVEPEVGIKKINALTVCIGLNTPKSRLLHSV